LNLLLQCHAHAPTRLSSSAWSDARSSVSFCIVHRVVPWSPPVGPSSRICHCAAPVPIGYRTHIDANDAAAVSVTPPTNHRGCTILVSFTRRPFPFPFSPSTLSPFSYPGWMCQSPRRSSPGPPMSPSSTALGRDQMTTRR
jgi:hypothetical protein